MLTQSNVRALRPAVVMMMNYRRILERLITRRWQNLDDDAGLSKPENCGLPCVMACSNFEVFK